MYKGCTVTKTSHLPIRYFLALLWAHPILHVSRIRVKVKLKGLRFGDKTSPRAQSNRNTYSVSQTGKKLWLDFYITQRVRRNSEQGVIWKGLTCFKICSYVGPVYICQGNFAADILFCFKTQRKQTDSISSQTRQYMFLFLILIFILTTRFSQMTIIRSSVQNLE